MDHDGARWIEELPAGLAAQQDLLRGLLAFSQADPGVKWLVMGCSLARGDRGDGSGLDVGRLLVAGLRVAELLGEAGGQLARPLGGRLWGMALLRVDARPLLPRLRAELSALLAGLDDDDWARPTACPGWPVHGVAAHLLGVELGNVSVRRDRWGLGPGEGEDLDSWLNAFNQQWVEAARRISPRLLAELINVAGLRFEEHVATLDLDAAGGPVPWATGTDPAPVWLDVAREYMERYVHQQQIRSATGRPPLGAAFTSPVLTTAAHALPRALDQVARPAGTVVTFTAEGEGGGSWLVVRAVSGWELDTSRPDRPAARPDRPAARPDRPAARPDRPAARPDRLAACQVRTSVEGALKLYARDPSAPPLTWQGDPELAEALAEVKAVLG